MMKLNMLAAFALVLGLGQMANGQQASQSDKPLTRDQLRTAVQEICPVSGQNLGAHGDPVKVKIGEEQIFLCCRGCLQGKVSAEHWATIHGNFAKAQSQCPVMNKPLPAGPKWTIVEGQIVYVCCPPCTKKIEADPKTYLEKVDELYSASLKARKAPR